VSELRIVAGKWRGRRIAVPSAGVRPTADRVRESWMSIIQQEIPDSRCADLCAGSGALGLELLSRGAEHCEFVEKDPAILKVLQTNIATLGAEAQSTIHRTKAETFLSSLTSEVPSPDKHPSSVIRPFHLALADPPYRNGIAESLIHIWLRAPFATIFCVEHEADLNLPDVPDSVTVDHRRYGDTALTIYRCNS
jgi:16S rRNA (guanine966-N2)-methyltransferase